MKHGCEECRKGRYEMIGYETIGFNGCSLIKETQTLFSPQSGQYNYVIHEDYRELNKHGDCPHFELWPLNWFGRLQRWWQGMRSNKP